MGVRWDDWKAARQYRREYAVRERRWLELVELDSWGTRERLVTDGCH